MKGELLSLKDEQLAQLAPENIDAFHVLLNRYESPLKRYILSISHFSIETAEDILQDVFLKVWKHIRSFSGEIKFSSWLYRIARNETISVFRKFSAKNEMHHIELTDDLFLPTQENFQQDFDRSILAQQIHSVFNQLPDKHKEVLVLKYFEDFSYEKISDILKKATGTVATLLFRAKEAFRVAAKKQSLSFSFES